MKNYLITAFIFVIFAPMPALNYAAYAPLRLFSSLRARLSAILFCIFIFLTFIWFSIPVLASYDFFDNKFGTRAVGMGGANTACAEGPETIFFNPAKKPSFSKLFLSIENGSRLGEPYYAAAVENPFNISSLRFGLLYKSENNIPETALNTYGHPTDTGRSFSFSSTALFVGWQQELLGLPVGVRADYLHENLFTQSGSGFDLAFSCYKDLTEDRLISWGLLGRHLLYPRFTWSSGYQDILQPIWTTGLAFRLLDQTLTAACDLELETHRMNRIYYGLEYWLYGTREMVNGLAVRGGIREGDLCLGVGLQFNGIILDYAYIQPKRDYLETEYRFSLGWSFNTYRPNPETRLSAASVRPDIQKLFQAAKQSELAPAPVLQVVTQAPVLPKKTLPRAASLISLISFDIAQNSLCALTVQMVTPSTTLRVYTPETVNGLNYALNQSMTLAMPTKLILRPSEQELILIWIEHTKSGHLLITGQMPKEYHILIDNDVVEAKNSGAFYYKLTPDQIKLERFDMVLYSESAR